MEWEKDYHRYTAALQGEARPLALLDEEALYENARRVLTYAGKLPVRIATKSIRSPAVLRRLFSFSERFQGLLCMSAREALYLAQEGFDNFFIGYPFYQAAELEAFRTLLERGFQVVAVVDHPAQVDALEKALEGTTLRAPVCMEVDVSSDWGILYFGVRRSPIRTAEEAVKLAQYIRTKPHLNLIGLLAYEAQIAGVGDKGLGWKSPILRLLKSRSYKEVVQQRKEIVEALQGAGFSLSLINGGGTGSLPETAADSTVTEVTAGSAFYAPALFDHYQKVSFVPAAGFSIEIVRRPAADIFTCHGGGYIASGAVGKEKLPKPWLPPHARFFPHEGAGEIQTPVQIPNPPAFIDIGAPLYFRHAKAGELTQRFPILHILRGEKLVEKALTYAALREVWV
ncbi:MAG: alanine racemase [Bacteroidia bacterium]|nr:alanine racemase [Bacteroidia bacterium]MDW8056835.1 alanine racemase [Bacteroidia bacterium]